MACAHAKFTGEVGVCLATSGPGAIHLLNGLYDAKMDHQPVVAIVGQAATTSMGGSTTSRRSICSTLFKDVAREYVTTVMSPAADAALDRSRHAHRARRAHRHLRHHPEGRAGAEQMATPPHKHGARRQRHRLLHAARGAARSTICSAPPTCSTPASKVAMLVGAGALGAAEEVIEVADLLGAGVAKALLGKAVLPDALAVGHRRHRPARHQAELGPDEDCDTLLMVGTSFPYSEFLPKEGQARGVQIDIDGRMLSLRYPMEVNLTATPRETLARAGAAALAQDAIARWREKIEKDMPTGGS